MIFKTWSVIFIGICLRLKTSSGLSETECNLKVEINYSEDPGIEPTVVCSSDCNTAEEKFFYYEETLAQKYNSLVQVSYDVQGRVSCEIQAITQDALERKIGKNCASKDETETIADDETSIDSPYSNNVERSFSPVTFADFDESTSDKTGEFQLKDFDASDESKKNNSQPPDTKSKLSDIEDVTKNGEAEYQLGTPMKDDESSVKVNKTFPPFTEEIGIKKQESGNQITTPQDDLQDESEKADENFEASQQEEIPNYQQDVDVQTNKSSLPRCPERWTLNLDSKMCYFVTHNEMNWFDANMVCVKLGGKLSVFHSQEEVKFVKENVGLPESSWIGLEYTIPENLTIKTWMWIDRSVADFTDWATGEPSSETSLWGSFWAYENCVEMKKSEDFAWNDESCKSSRRALCSKEADLIPRTTCPDDWLRRENKCYHFCAEELPEEVAVLQCSSHASGVKLFAPEGTTEMEYVSGNLKERNISSIWLGIKDTQEKGDFRTPEGELQKFFSWDINEPSKSFWWTSTKDCVKMSSESKMKREKCGQKLPFVCSFDLLIISK